MSSFLFLTILPVAVLTVLMGGEIFMRGFTRWREWRLTVLEARERAKWNKIIEEGGERVRPCDVVFLRSTEQWKAMHGSDKDVA